MESLPLDMTAREHIKQDERGRQCAVLRIATQNITPGQREGFHFECDYASFVVERQIVEGEIWVWVSPGMKTLKIKSKLGNVDMHTANYGTCSAGFPIQPCRNIRICNPIRQRTIRLFRIENADIQYKILNL